MFSGGVQPYIRLLGEHAIITVPREDAIITVRKKEDENLTLPSKDTTNENNHRNIFNNLMFERCFLINFITDFI